jgi:hypothetical protein
MYVGGHLVDLSPLSTIGALCIAALPNEAGAKKLFNQCCGGASSMMVGRRGDLLDPVLVAKEPLGSQKDRRPTGNRITSPGGGR